MLFVEADRGLREMAAGLLSRLGYSVLAAATGDEAMELIGRRGAEPIDLLLTDADQTGLNGNDLAGRCRAAHPDIRTLFTSGGATHDDQQSATIAGTAFLPKPFTPGALAQKVRELLDRA